MGNLADVHNTALKAGTAFYIERTVTRTRNKLFFTVAQDGNAAWTPDIKQAVRFGRRRDAVSIRSLLFVLCGRLPAMRINERFTCD